MSERRPRWGVLAGTGTTLAAAGCLLAVFRSPEARANLAWTLGSWRRPADRNSYCQQRAGKRVDPLDRLRRGV